MNITIISKIIRDIKNSVYLNYILEGVREMP